MDIAATKRKQTDRMSNLVFMALLALLLAVLWKTVWYIVPSPKLPQPFHGGFVHPAFQEVMEVFKQSVESGRELGASFSVFREGVPLVDLWGGYADLQARKPWQQDTISQAWSCTKGVAAVVMAILVDRGQLDYQALVKDYWPEFAQNGKDNITVGVLLSHQAGLVSVGRQLSLTEYRDQWNVVESLLAAQHPAWIPGSRYSYHAFTFGMYADALVRRVDPAARNLSTFFMEEVARPFDLDFYVGLPLDKFYRSARGQYVSIMDILLFKFVLQPRMWAWLPEVFAGHIFKNALSVFDFTNDMNVMNDAMQQSVGLPSALGFGTARSLAKLYSILANNGEIEGKRLISLRQIQSLSDPVTQEIPVIVAPDQPFTMGMMAETNLLGNMTFGHRGYGGQVGYADPSHRLGVAYFTNFNSVYSDCDDPRVQELLQVFYKCLIKYNKLPEDEK